LTYDLGLLAGNPTSQALVGFSRYRAAQEAALEESWIQLDGCGWSKARGFSK